MTEVGPTGQRTQPPAEGPPAPSSAVERLGRFTAANMLRSMLPLLVICLLLVGWVTFRQSGDTGVRTVDPSSTVQLAAARAGYQVLVPTGLPESWQATSARTDAGNASDGDPVTLEVGYLTPLEEYAGFVLTDDASAAALTGVVEGAQEEGVRVLGDRTWVRLRTERSETALVFERDGVTVLVTGSATDEELDALAAAVHSYPS